MAAPNIENRGVVGYFGSPGVYFIPLTPVAVAANTTAEQTFTLSGAVAATDAVAGLVSQSAPQAGLSIVSARISADNTLAVTWGNWTAGTITPTAGLIYMLSLVRVPAPRPAAI